MHLELHLHNRLTFDILQCIHSRANLAEYAPVCQDDSTVGMHFKDQIDTKKVAGKDKSGDGRN